MSHAGAASSPRSRRPADPQDDNATTDDEHAAVVSRSRSPRRGKSYNGLVQPRLPLAKHDDSSLRRPIAILFFLQSLSLVPAMVGFGVCWSHALAKGTMEGYSTRADWMVASLWVRASTVASMPAVTLLTVHHDGLFELLASGRTHPTLARLLRPRAGMVRLLAYRRGSKSQRAHSVFASLGFKPSSGR
jgi:hypothetical protein